MQKFPSRYTVAKNTQELDPRCPQDHLIDYQEEAIWLDNVNGRRGRGRGIRGSRPTARGRGRGRGLRGIGSSTRTEFKVRGTLGTHVKTARKYTRRGGKARGGGRGRQRGRRTPRPRQRSESSRVPVVKVTLSDHFNTGTSSSTKRDKIVEPPVSMSRVQWGLGGGKRGSYFEEAEDNNSIDNSIESESEDQVQPSEDEYDDQAMDFTQVYNCNEPTGLMDDESEEDGDAEEEEDDDDGVQEGQEEIDEAEDEEMGDEYGEEVGDDYVNGDEEEEDDEAPLSFSSSDYSSS